MNGERDAKGLGILLAIFMVIILFIALAQAIFADVHTIGDSVAISAVVPSPSTGLPVSGATVQAAIVRASDGYWYDWTAGTFTASGWSAQWGTLTEQGALGVYLAAVDTTGWTAGSYDALIKSTSQGASGIVSWTLSTVTSGGVAAGSGEIAVTQDYGGTGELKILDSLGAAIDGALIRAYTATDYTAGRLGAAYIRGQTTTESSGDWTTPIYLDPGTYKLIVTAAGQTTLVIDLTVTEG